MTPTPPAPPPDHIDLTRYAAQIDNAMGDGHVCTIATSDAAGHVDIGLKGSVMVFDQDHLAFLERTHGGHLENLRQNPHIAVMYFNRSAAITQLRLFGEATLHEAGDLREQIRNRTIPIELARDPDNR